MKTTLIYALHSGGLYGTERMALATAQGLRNDFDIVVFAPDGEALAEARRLGFATCAFKSPIDFAIQLRPFFARHQQLAFIATGVVHSLAAVAWNALYRRQLTHLHVVHGGADELSSYGRKRRLNGTHVTFVAVSDFVRTRLIANGVRADKIIVVENFLTYDHILRCRKRPKFARAGLTKLVVVSRVDPIKRIDLLLNALDQTPELGQVSIRVLGTGWDLDTMRARAAERNPNVTFVGFTSEVEKELAASDLLVHLCPNEPFGLAILEAMAAGVPVLVPNSGGAGSLVEDGATGFHFEANNAQSLATHIRSLLDASPDLLNDVVSRGRKSLVERFSQTAGISNYRQLLEGGSV
ncbi:MAG TPA: glycosyltransferase family 4 protein [Pyrinomonadaceae bacterium]|nr:glycosyltransferase family 4 protein [Pyrinomonadaceae bacterium]